MWTEVLIAPCETEKGLRGSEGCTQRIGSQGRGFEHSQSCAWWTALSRCFTRSSRARPSMALCSARVEPGIGWERQHHRDLGTRVVMKFLRSAFEGPESHQSRTMGLKRGLKERTYAWTCWSNALQKAKQKGRKNGAVRSLNSGSREAYHTCPEEGPLAVLCEDLHHHPKGTIHTIDLVGASITVVYVTLPQMRVLHHSGAHHTPFLQLPEWPQYRLFHQYLTQTARAAGHTLPGSKDMRTAYREFTKQHPRPIPA